jgi:hypothetical protein
MECKYTHFEFQYDWIEHKNGKRVDKRSKVVFISTQLLSYK